MGGIHVNATFTHSVVWQPFYKDRSKICAGADDVNVVIHSPVAPGRLTLTEY